MAPWTLRVPNHQVDGTAKNKSAKNSGHYLRRVLAAISNTKDVGDVTTLANPDVVDEIINMVSN